MPRASSRMRDRDGGGMPPRPARPSSRRPLAASPPRATRRRGPRDRRGRRCDRRAGQPLLRLQGGALRRGDPARPRHGAPAPGPAGRTWRTTSPGLMVYGREDSPDGVLTPLLLLLHSAAEPGALKLFRRDLDRTELPLLAEQIGGDDAAVRAVMVMAQLTGFAIMYHVLRPKAFADCPWRGAGGPPVRGPRRLHQVRPRGYGTRSLFAAHRGRRP